ncbi:MAG: ABC transporter ATP-binding protein/permease [Lachnospiraceae bacterium]|nr:ABC transporter ATP-binding protein/permease [Lachnospiraceae bacterium]
MLRLIGLVKPLTGYMILAICMGLIGHLCATFITVFGGYAVLDLLGVDTSLSLGAVFACVILFAVLRAGLRYGEQACNHFIAFKLLALIRDQVFRALRKLCPAKLEGRDRGDLISIITSDIELLEVFYAHTISPAAIALFYTIILCLFIGSFHWELGVLALAAYLVVGIVIPLAVSRFSGDIGLQFRTKSGDLSGFVLDSMRGLTETIQYNQGSMRLEEMNAQTDALSKDEERMKRNQGLNSAVTNTIILLFDCAMLFTSAFLFKQGQVGFAGVLIPTIALFSSFGPAVALAALGSTLQNTFAAGNRVLDILEESPVTEEITGQQDVAFRGASAEHVTFSYSEMDASSRSVKTTSGETASRSSKAEPVKMTSRSSKAEPVKMTSRSSKAEPVKMTSHLMEDQTLEASLCYATNDPEIILQDVSVDFPEHQIIGITGISGSGKSTLLKLLMRFWTVNQGKITISGTSVDQINTANLRDMESFVTQETHLFHDSIRNNLRIAKLDATDEEIAAACKKASVHDFIMTLPQGYDTPVGELGSTLSGGERQRLGLAQAFLHDAPFLLLDEPTSNLDSLNEAVILRSLKEAQEGKTIVLVSHRQSTMRIADKTYSVEHGRVS